MGLLLHFFLCNFSSFLSTSEVSFFTVIDCSVYFGYSANYNNTRGAFAILFLICSNLLNCLRSIGIMFTTGSLFWCMFCTATPDISSSSENINSTARVSKLYFRFLWLCFHFLFTYSLTEIKILLSCGRLLKKKNLSKITCNLPLYSELHCWRLFLSKYEKVLYMFWKVLSEWHLCMCLVYCSWPKFNWVNLK